MRNIEMRIVCRKCNSIWISHSSRLYKLFQFIFRCKNPINRTVMTIGDVNISSFGNRQIIEKMTFTFYARTYFLISFFV